MPEDDLDDVDGWLQFYAVIRIAIAVLSLVLVWTGLPGVPATLHYLYLIIAVSLIPVFSGLAAGIGIVRTSSWAITAVAVDMAVNLAFIAVEDFQNGLHSPLVLLREAIQLAILYAWFQYFRTSKRVRNALGRNLFANAPSTEDLQTSSEY
jgi:hypothetical protein